MAKNPQAKNIEKVVDFPNADKTNTEKSPQPDMHAHSSSSSSSNSSSSSSRVVVVVVVVVVSTTAQNLLYS